MTDPVEQVAAYAARWQAVQVEPAVDWSRVTGRRRTSWGPAVAVAAAVLLVVAGVGGTASLLGGRSGAPTGPTSGTGPAGSGLRYDVPWVNRPTPPPVPYAPPPTTPPSTWAPPCTAAQVSAQLSVGNGMSQNDGRILLFRNTSSATCLLAGVPAVIATGPGLPAYRLPPVPPEQDSAGITAPMAPGHLTKLWISDPRDCAANQGSGAQAGPLYTTLRIFLPGGAGRGSAVVTGLSLHPTCGVFVSRFFRVPAPVPLPVSPLEKLTVAVTVPATARAGDLLTYVVTLTNPAAQPISLTPCPGYLEFGRAGGSVLFKEEYALNCAPVPVIPAGRSLRFQMKAQVPASAPPGPLTLSWTFLPNGETASGGVRVVGR